MGGAGLGNAQQHGRDFTASQIGPSLSISFPPAQRVKRAVRLTFLTTATRTPALFPFSLHRTAAVFLGQRKLDFFFHREAFSAVNFRRSLFGFLRLSVPEAIHERSSVLQSPSRSYARATRGNACIVAIYKAR